MNGLRQIIRNNDKAHKDWEKKIQEKRTNTAIKDGWRKVQGAETPEGEK